MKIFRLIAFAALLITAQATEAQEQEFKPSGSPFVKVFANFHYGTEKSTAFEMQRAYLGYKYNMSKNWSGKVSLDIGNPEVALNDSMKTNTSLQHTAYLKNALMSYKIGNFGFSFGLIGTKQFKIQEKYWGHRYIYKSFQDAYKLGSSADLGVSFNYKLTDFLSMDISILNGEGYKKIQADEHYKGGLGITINPVKNLIFRAYTDYLKGSDAQMSMALFLGYKLEKLTVGAEYNTQANHKNNEDHDLNGISGYASYDLNKKWQIFGRYDMLGSNRLEGSDAAWNINKDGSAMIGGLQFRPVRGIKVSANYQGWTQAEANTKIEHFGYLNVEIAF